MRERKNGRHSSTGHRLDELDGDVVRVAEVDGVEQASGSLEFCLNDGDNDLTNNEGGWGRD